MEKDWILSECALLIIFPFPNNSQSDFFFCQITTDPIYPFRFHEKRWGRGKWGSPGPINRTVPDFFENSKNPDGVVGNRAPQAPLIEQSQIFLKFEKPKYATVHKEKTLL